MRKTDYEFNCPSYYMGLSYHSPYFRKCLVFHDKKIKLFTPAQASASVSHIQMISY